MGWLVSHSLSLYICDKYDVIMQLFFYTCVDISIINFILNPFVTCFLRILALVICFGFAVTKIKQQKYF